MAREGELSRTDDPQPEREGATTGGERLQYILKVPECIVTVDGYTPFQAHVIAILLRIEAAVSEIRDSVK